MTTESIDLDAMSYEQIDELFNELAQTKSRYNNPSSSDNVPAEKLVTTQKKLLNQNNLSPKALYFLGRAYAEGTLIEYEMLEDQDHITGLSSTLKSREASNGGLGANLEKATSYLNGIQDENARKRLAATLNEKEEEKFKPLLDKFLNAFKKEFGDLDDEDNSKVSPKKIDFLKKIHGNLTDSKTTSKAKIDYIRANSTNIKSELKEHTGGFLKALNELLEVISEKLHIKTKSEGKMERVMENTGLTLRK